MAKTPVYLILKCYPKDQVTDKKQLVPGYFPVLFKAKNSTNSPQLTHESILVSSLLLLSLGKHP